MTSFFFSVVVVLCSETAVVDAVPPSWFTVGGVLMVSVVVFALSFCPFVSSEKLFASFRWSLDRWICVEKVRFFQEMNGKETYCNSIGRVYDGFLFLWCNWYQSRAPLRLMRRKVTPFFTVSLATLSLEGESDASQVDFILVPDHSSWWLSDVGATEHQLASGTPLVKLQAETTGPKVSSFVSHRKKHAKNQKRHPSNEHHTASNRAPPATRAATDFSIQCATNHNRRAYLAATPPLILYLIRSRDQQRQRTIEQKAFLDSTDKNLHHQNQNHHNNKEIHHHHNNNKANFPKAKNTWTHKPTNQPNERERKSKQIFFNSPHNNKIQSSQ